MMQRGGGLGKGQQTEDKMHARRGRQTAGKEEEEKEEGGGEDEEEEREGWVGQGGRIKCCYKSTRGTSLDFSWLLRFCFAGWLSASLVEGLLSSICGVTRKSYHTAPF